MAEVLRPRTFSELLGQTFSVALGSLPKLLRILLWVWAPILLLGLIPIAVGHYGLEIASAKSRVGEVLISLNALLISLLGFAFGPIAQGATILAVADRFTGGDTPVRECYSAVARRVFSLIGLGLCLGLIVLVGCCFFVIPGLLLWARLYVAIPVMILEDKGIIDSINRSWNLTMEQWGRAIAFVLIMLVIFYLIYGIVQFPMIYVLVTTKSFAMEGLTRVLSFVLGQVVMTLFTSVAAVVMYFELRTRKEALDLQGLVSLVGHLEPTEPPEESPF